MPWVRRSLSMEPTLPHAPFAFLPRDSRRWQERDTPASDAILWFYEDKDRPSKRQTDKLRVEIVPPIESKNANNLLLLNCFYLGLARRRSRYLRL